MVDLLFSEVSVLGGGKLRGLLEPGKRTLVRQR
jgi:hypothetical protein